MRNVAQDSKLKTSTTLKPFKYILSIFLAAAMSGCVYDDFADFDGEGEEPSSPTYKGKLYVDFNISTTDGKALVPATVSRATDPGDGFFEDGTDDFEQKLGTNGNFVLLFRPENDTFFAMTPLSLKNEEEDELEIEHSYTAILNPDDFGFEISEEELLRNMNGYYDENPGVVPRLLANCVILLNAMDCYSTFMGWAEKQDHKLKDVIDYIWTDKENPFRIGRDNVQGTGFFTMSNSVYMDREGKLQQAVPITVRSVYETANPASKAAAIAATVYVERMSAKVTLDVMDLDDEVSRGVTESDTEYVLDDDGFIYFTTKNNEVAYCLGFEKNNVSGEYEPVNVSRKWRVKFTGWNINGLQQQSYLFKKINTGGYGFFNGWNDPSNFRTYWCEDPDYDGGFYPWQFRAAVNISNDPYDSVEGKTVTNTLRNYSYEEIAANGFDGEARYFPEHTFNPETHKDAQYDDRANTTVGTHLIVTAELQTDLDTGGDYRSNDIYRDRNGVFYRDKRDCLWALLRAFNHELEAQTIMEFMWYDWSKRTAIDNSNKRFAFPHKSKYYLYIDDEPLTYEYVHDKSRLPDNVLESYFIPATVKDGDGKVMIWIPGINVRDVNGNYISVYDKIEVNTNFTTGQIEYHFGNAIDYSKGSNLENTIKSIFYEWTGAIDHFKDGKMYYYAPAMIKEKICGIVRNNWYKFRLNDLRRIGTSVDNPYDPIVPNKVYTRDQLNITVDLLEWHSEEVMWDIIN